MEECQGEVELDGETFQSDKPPNRLNEITSATIVVGFTTNGRRRFSKEKRVRNDEIEL
jgi:predicted DNA-binding protein (UPF0278 family)